METRMILTQSSALMFAAIGIQMVQLHIEAQKVSNFVLFHLSWLTNFLNVLCALSQINTHNHIQQDLHLIYRFFYVESTLHNWLKWFFKWAVHNIIVWLTHAQYNLLEKEQLQCLLAGFLWRFQSESFRNSSLSFTGSSLSWTLVMVTLPPIKITYISAENLHKSSRLKPIWIFENPTACIRLWSCWLSLIYKFANYLLFLHVGSRCIRTTFMSIKAQPCRLDGPTAAFSASGEIILRVVHSSHRPVCILLADAAVSVLRPFSPCWHEPRISYS